MPRHDARWRADGAEAALLIDLARASSIASPDVHVTSTLGFLRAFREHVTGARAAGSMRLPRSRAALLLVAGLVIGVSQLKPKSVGQDPLTYRIKTLAAPERGRSGGAELGRAGRPRELLVEIVKHDR